MQTEIDSAITPSGTSEEVRSFKNKLGGLLTSNMRTSKELRTDFETYLWGTKNIFEKFLQVRSVWVMLRAIKVVTKIYAEVVNF